MNLMKILPVTTVIVLIGTVVFFFREAMGAISPVIGAVAALAIVGFLGWFVIDYTH